LGSKEDMCRIIDYTRGTVVLHNYLIGDIDDDWIADENLEGEDDLEPESLATSNVADYSRRDELYYYLSELEDTPIN
jgi:hypothetical protein